MQDPFTFWAGIAGGPNVGKGSAVRELCRRVKRATGVELPTKAAGELLASPETELIRMGLTPEEARSVPITRAAGDLVAANIVETVMRNALIELRQSDRALVDGFPRLMEDIPIVNELFPLTHLILLSASDEVIAKRAEGRWTNMQTQRTFSATCDGIDPKDPRDPETGQRLERRRDDAAERVPKRLHTYRTITAVTLEAYCRQRHDLRIAEIDTSDLSPTKVVDRICHEFGWHQLLAA